VSDKKDFKQTEIPKKAFTVVYHSKFQDSLHRKASPEMGNWGSSVLSLITVQLV